MNANSECECPVDFGSVSRCLCLRGILICRVKNTSACVTVHLRHEQTQCLEYETRVCCCFSPMVTVLTLPLKQLFHPCPA